jgi:regulator of replication initiation timing
MDSHTRERVEDWDDIPCAAGLEGFRDLADKEFSGVVTGTGVWAFVLNGRIVGLDGGTLEDLEGTPLTAYRAPDPALPLLFAMQAQGGETQAEYYTNDTPIGEAKRTLSDGSFTGYIELSENVLSGDYYVCFYGGRALPIAFIGSSERLLSGDEAFERANDEVGIYEVKAVDVEVTEIPAPDDESEPSASSVATDASTEDDGEDDDTTEEFQPDEPASEETGATPSEAMSQTDDADGLDAEDGTTEIEVSGGETDDSGVTSSPDRGSTSAPETTEAQPTEPRDHAATRDSDDTQEPTARDSPSETGRSSPRRQEGRERESGASRTHQTNTQDRTQKRAASTGTDQPSGDDPRFEREAEWRETRQIPSIDPDRSEAADEPRAVSGAGEAGSSSPTKASRSADSPGSGRRDRTQREGSGGRREDADRTGGHGEESTPRADNSGGTRRRSPAEGTIEKPLEQDMLEREDEIDQLQQRVSDLESKRESLQAERDTLERENGRLEEENERLQNRVGELEDEVSELESQIEELEAAVDSGSARKADSAVASSDASRDMSPAQALSATNLFLRYDSKGQATLEDVHASDADAEALNANLRLEHHTNFDATSVTVDGTPYAQFLEASIHYEFVEWLLREFPFEIRETGNAGAMDRLYDAIPKIDRVECMGRVDIAAAEDADEGGRREFDIVARDRMGDPLIIANLNDSLDAATENMMVNLQESATAVKEAADDLAAGFMVTTSFFDSGALEVAAEATSGSLLSRDSRKSFVKLSRKRGYHLCLVETREGNFHVNVPEL